MFFELKKKKKKGKKVDDIGQCDDACTKQICASLERIMIPFKPPKSKPNALPRESTWMTEIETPKREDKVT
jgi:hypothetical protein